MSGVALSGFTDFVSLTGPTYLRGPEDIFNEASKHSYVLSKFLKGRGKSESIQGGDKIKDVVMFDESNTAVTYKPNATFTWQNPQVSTEQSIDWRFIADHMAWTDQEVELNAGGNLSDKARGEAYKRLKYLKEQRMWTSWLNKWEELLWADPTSAQASMEAESGQEIYSLPAFVNENSSGLYTGWTTVMGINASTQDKWRPQRHQYDYVDPDDSDEDNDGLFDAFDAMFYKVRFQSPGTKDNYFNNDKMARQFIACSRVGINLYQKLLRNGNDRFVNQSRQDPSYSNPTYAGIELVYVGQLDTATVYPTSSTETAATTPGPRYYWFDANYLFPVFHQTRYMKVKEPMQHPNQPFTTVQVMDCWMNMFCRSRQRQGIVYPGA